MNLQPSDVAVAILVTLLVVGGLIVAILYIATKDIGE